MDWTVGRAGMLYADLLPDRAGGALLANRIRIEGGGAVGDWVHYHEVAFQLIFVLRGRVRLVYEDQGPPFWAGPGDAVLQPPTIRHQVLETDDGLEVLELVSPAAHTTHADPDLALPTPDHRPDRPFGGQRFLWSTGGTWSDHGDVQRREIGVAAATRGVAGVALWRSDGGGTVERPASEAVRVFFVVRGAVEVAGEPVEAGRLVRSELALTLALGAGAVVLEAEVRSPG